MYSRNPITYESQFKRIRNKVTNKIRTARKQFFRNKLINCKGNAKNTWGVINSVLNRKKKDNLSNLTIIDNEGNKHNDPASVAEVFAEYFSSVGQSLSDRIQNIETDPEYFFGNRALNEIVLVETDETEIVELVASLNDAAPGYDDIPMSIIKFVIDEIKSPLVHICNGSLNSGIFPDKLKLSKVIPLFKSINKSELGNYRPISLLPSFSKVLEKLNHSRLDTFFQENNIISPDQHGFQTGRSTTSAILNLTDNILQKFDQKHFTVGLFLDFSKAFDTVNHEILLNKLENYGIRNTSLRLIKNYLQCRKQYVYYSKLKSSQYNINLSIPQGSILGPLLFNVYINDIKNSVNKLKLVLYADDSCFYASGPDLNSVINVINEELHELDKWVKANRLTLSYSKSHYILFHRQLNIPDNYSRIRIDNISINEVKQTKFLGIVINYNLKWDTHVNNIV